MTTAEVATQLVMLFRKGKFLDAVNTLYADSIVSVKAVDYQGLGREMRGKGAILAKNVAWFKDNDVHNASATGPFVSPEKFAVCYSLGWTRNASGVRVQLSSGGVHAGGRKTRARRVLVPSLTPAA